MSIETYETIAENYYDKDGNFVCRCDFDSEDEQDIPESAWEVRAVAIVDGEETEIEAAMSFDWKESPDDVVSRVNEVLKEFGLEIEFVELNRSDGAYHFGVLDLCS